MRRALFKWVFWVDAIERAIKSFAQGVLAAIGQDAVGVDWYNARLATVLGTGGTMACLSILTSIMSAGVSSDVSPASAVPGPSTPPDKGAVSVIEIVAILVGICAVVWLVKVL